MQPSLSRRCTFVGSVPLLADFTIFKKRKKKRKKMILKIKKDIKYDLASSSREGKGMFYLTTLSTHFILQLYGIRHMVKDHSDSEKGNPLPPHRLLFPINSKGPFICTIQQTG